MKQKINLIKEFSFVPISWHRGDSGNAFRGDFLRPNPKKAIHIENVKEYTKVAEVKQ